MHIIDEISLKIQELIQEVDEAKEFSNTQKAEIIERLSEANEEVEKC